jgi:serine/threonine-protein kinase RsbW
MGKSGYCSCHSQNYLEYETTKVDSVSGADQVSYHVDATATDTGAVRQALMAWARRSGIGGEPQYALVLACYEAMANAVIHAYSSDPGQVDVQAVIIDYHNERILTATVTDHGRWKPPASKSFGGYGLTLVRQLAHHHDIEPTDDGTIVRMTWIL